MELLAPNGNKSNLTAEQYELVRTPEFKAWFGDWENAPENASKFVDNNGEPKVMYHQTSDTVKNILYKEGIFKKGFESASKNDKETPYGFFFKKIKDNIGLKGVSQISVFLDSKKPLFFKERSDINLFFNDAVNGFSENNLEYERNDIEYQKEFNEQMKKASSMFKIHGTESDIGKLTRKTFEEESTELLGEWAEKNNDISVAQKKLMTDFLKNNDYDSMVIENDEGSFGRKTDATIVFDSNQIKLADGSNTTFDSSNPDIRFDDGGEITIDSKPFTDIPDYDMTIKEAFEAIADAPYDRGNAKYFGDWLKRLGWKIKFNRGIELDDWHEGGEEKTWRLFDRVAESNQEDGWIGTYYSRQEAEAHKRRLTLVLSKNNFVVKVNSNTNQIEVNSPDIRFDEGGEISKNIDSQLKKIGFTFNTANYRYGKNVDERTYISAFYDKNKQLYKIGGVKKFKTPLGGNSVGIKFEYDNKKEFWQKINEFTSTYNPDIRFEGGGVIDNPNFKKWFGDSKVVSDDGKPMIMYHGSPNVHDIKVFANKRGRGDFYYFTDSEDEAIRYTASEDNNWTWDTDNVKLFYIKADRIFDYETLSNSKKEEVDLLLKSNAKYFLSLYEPSALLLLEEDHDLSTMDTYEIVKLLFHGLDNYIILESPKMQSFIRENGYDSFRTLESGGDDLNIAVFNPNQIKLADGSNTTFDGDNPDIRFDEGGVIDNPNFKKWFGDSKVVNDKGNPLAVYHGSTEEFYEFEKYSYFTDDWWNADGYANGEVVYEVYLSLQNPLVIDGKGKKWDEIETPYGTSTREVVDNVDKIKYDGIIFNNIKDSWIDDAEHQEPSTVYVAFSPNQIKLADGTTFDGNNPDIRFDEGGEVDADSIRKELIGIYSSVHENKRQSIISSEEGGKELLSLAINQGGNIGNSIAQASQNYLLLPMSIKLINNGYSNFSVEYYYFPKPNSNTRVKITYKELWDDEDYSESFTREQHKKAIMENPIPVLYDSTILNENGELINNKFKDIDSDSELRYGKKDADHLFRGMSKKELDSILVNGYIKSNASMNIGETQMNTTSFAQHISQASNYAYGFTAWYDSVVFDEPKYVVKVKRDGLKYSPTLPSDPDNEVDVFGEVPIENIVAIYEIRLGSARSGNFELVQEYNGTVREGSGSGAYTKAYFRKITDFKNSDIRFDDGGVVKENYFEGELSFLNW